MIAFSREKIVHVGLVRRFPRDEILRRKVFDFEDALKPIFAGVQPQVINQPQEAGAGISQPYYVFNDGKKQFAVGANLCQLSLDFREGWPQKETISSIVAKYARVLDQANRTIMGSQTIGFHGIVVEYTRAYSGNIDEINQILNKFLNIENITDEFRNNTVSFSLRSNNVNRNFEFSSYSLFTKTGNVGPAVAPVFISVDPDFDQPVEIGLNIKVDVNTKPKVDNIQQVGFMSLLPYLEKALKTDLPIILPNDIVPTLGV